MGQGVLGQGPDEHHLQENVDRGPDQHGEDHRPGHVTLGVPALAAQLDGLLEADQREHRSTVTHRPQDPVETVGGEAAGTGEVGGVEVGEEEHQDGQGGDDHLPGGDGAVDPDQVADAEQVDHDEECHQHRRNRVAEGGEDRHATDGVGQPVPVIRGIGNGRLHLDGGGTCRLQPREPPERGTGQPAEGVVGEPGGSAADREHPPELGVHQGEQDDRQRSDEPGDEGRRPTDGGAEQGAEEPARSDDRALRGEQQPEEPDVAIESVAGG